VAAIAKFHIPINYMASNLINNNNKGSIVLENNINHILGPHLTV
jgi:hypothetical protein